MVLTMCFRNYCEYYPEVYEVTKGTGTGWGLCDECNQKVEKGQWRLEIYTQQYENPINGVWIEDKDEYAVPAGEEPNYGDCNDYTRCESCHLVLEVIRKVEEEEGCRGDQTQPLLTELWAALNNDEEGKYLNRIRAEHPELNDHLKLLGVEG